MAHQWPREAMKGNLTRAGIYKKKSMGARHRDGIIVLSYWPDRLQRLAELMPWNQFLGSIND